MLVGAEAARGVDLIPGMVESRADGERSVAGLPTQLNPDRVRQDRPFAEATFEYRRVPLRHHVLPPGRTASANLPS
jgi:hypothetical protein